MRPTSPALAASAAPVAVTGASAAPRPDARPALAAPGGARRVALHAGWLVAAVATLAFVPDAPALARDADWARLIRLMTLVKGALLVAAVAALHWRLARPVAGWRLGAYLALAAVGSASVAAMWRGVVPGTVALVLHGAGLALLLVAWRDPSFLPAARPARVTPER